MSKVKTKKAAKNPTDPRLARIYGLIDDLWRSDFSVEAPIKRMFEDIDWGDVEPEKVKRMIAVLFEPNGPDFDDAEPRRDHLSAIADDEHRMICACCRSDKKTIGRAA